MKNRLFIGACFVLFHIACKKSNNPETITYLGFFKKDSIESYFSRIETDTSSEKTKVLSYTKDLFKEKSISDENILGTYFIGTSSAGFHFKIDNTSQLMKLKGDPRVSKIEQNNTFKSF